MERFVLSAAMLGAIGLFADANLPHSQAVGMDGWQNLTALSAVIITLLWIVTKTLPSLFSQQAEQSKTFTDSLERSQANFTTTLDKMHERNSNDLGGVKDELTRLREHCAGKCQQR